MGETSALACLIGAVILIVTGIGSWRTMAGVALGTIAMAIAVQRRSARATNPYFAVPFWWHMVAGGWAFGTVFMATDPVTSPFTETRQVDLRHPDRRVRRADPRRSTPPIPNAMMLVILFMNVMAPVIDYGSIKANINRRMQRRAED